MGQPLSVIRVERNSTRRIPPCPSPDEWPRTSLPGPGPDHEIIREDSRLGAITIREIALFIAVVAIAQRILPRPLGLLAATSLPALYFPARIDPRLARPIGLSVLIGIILAAFLPAWGTNEPADLTLGKITALALAPLLARIATWRCRSGLWDLLDPFVIASAPLAFTIPFVVAARLLELGFFSWN